jgi:cobalamin biosynthesis Mg chelatase CobN
MQAEDMQVQDRTSRRDGSGRPVLSTKEARQGVTGHNVRYVLAVGLAAVVIAFAVGYLAVRGLG